MDSVAPAPTTASAVSASTASSDIPPSSNFAGFTGFGASGVPGGMASSPNVPAPGTSLDPSTGLPHTAGLTRAELEARKAAAAGGAQSSGLMGGLGTSPNVPTPGSSINPATGQSHSEGLTRAELDAIKEKGKGLLDPVPTGIELRRESAIRQNFAAPDLSGREQAAKQLTGTGVGAGLGVPASPTARRGSIVEDVSKTVREIGQKAYESVPAGVKDIFAEPKGKGVEGSPIKARRGSAAALFENVRVQATKIGTDIAHTVKEAVVYDPDAPGATTLPAASTTSGPISGLKDGHVAPINANLDPASASPRRASVLDTVTLQAKRLSQDVQSTLNQAASKSNAEGGVLSQVKGFVRDAFQDPGDSAGGTTFASPAQRYAFGTVPVVAGRTPPTASSATVPSVSLPSQENQGARPGEVAGGVGALPGKLSEAGVAVPPAVRETEGSASGLITTPTAPTSSTSGSSAGHGLGGLAGVGAGAGAGGIVAALLSEPRTGDNVSGLKNHSVNSVASTITDAITGTTTAPVGTTTGSGSGIVAGLGTHTGSGLGADSARATGTSTTTSGLPDLSATTAAGNSHYNLAAALPATILGTGAAHGATDIEATRGVDASTASSTAPTTAASALESSPATSLLSPGREPNNRTESLASVTAIRHGHAGSRDHTGETSPLATLPSNEDVTVTDGQKSTTRGTGPNHTLSLSPGGEAQGVGHPETKEMEGTSRTPGNYPVANPAGPAVGEAAHKKEDSHASTVAPSTTAPASATNKDVTSSTANGHAAPATPSKASTSTPVAASAISPAGRKSLEKSGDAHKRTGSSGSTGKKVGFMQKLKGEVKIISGKMKHDESKIALGEKMKHGEA